MANRADKGTYLLGEDTTRPRPAFAVRAYTHKWIERVPAIAVESEEYEEDGKVLRRDVEHKIIKNVQREDELVDLLVLLEPEDKKRGATALQVLDGYLPLTGVKVGEAPGFFQPEA